MHKPLGQPVRTTTYCDTNLMYDLLTGRSMSGIITLLNQTPIQWFAKKQATVETATYGSEFLVARQATEQILDLRYTLRMMGIPIDSRPSYLAITAVLSPLQPSHILPETNDTTPFPTTMFAKALLPKLSTSSTCLEYTTPVTS